MKRLLDSFRAVDGRQVFALCALVYLALAPSHGFGESWCLFHALFNVDCPACGLTRSMSCALHGEMAASWGYHPLGVFALGALALAGFAPARFSRTLSYITGGASTKRRVVFGAVTLIVAVWLTKIIT